MKIKHLALISIALLLTSCAQSLNVKQKSEFEGQTGIIGVFRQPVGFCSGGYQQQIILGNEKIIVKPTWTSRQDNMFSAHLKSGTAELKQYHYACGMTSTTLSPKFSAGVSIPGNGFCKIVISFLPEDVKNGNIFQKDDVVLKRYFKEERVAIPYEDIPFCELL